LSLGEGGAVEIDQVVGNFVNGFRVRRWHQAIGCHPLANERRPITHGEVLRLW